MKSRYRRAAAALMAALVGCTAEDIWDRGVHHGNSVEQESMEKVMDTLLLVCAVEVEDGYDWQRDTACGAFKADVVLFRDGEVWTRVPAGTLASTDADMIHIIDGHLYTEVSGPDWTVLACDGMAILNLNTREYMLGIVRKGDNLYTLSRNRDGSGLNLRKNGVPMLHKDAGEAFGYLGDPSYGPTGALYEDEGHICFCYHNGADCIRVVDGIESTPTGCSGSIPQDMKIIGGRTYLLEGRKGGTYLLDGRIWGTGGMVRFTGGVSSTPYGKASACVCGKIESNVAETVMRKGGYVCLGEAGAFSVLEDRSSGISVWWRGTMFMAEEGYRIMSGACVSSAMGFPVLALSPTGKGTVPCVMIGRKKIEVGINGYLAAVSCSISPPS